MNKYTILIAISILLISCASKTDDPFNDDPVFEYNKKSATFIETNNSFGLDLFKIVNRDEDKPNLMISPSSISIALGMAYNGSESSTKQAFEELLNYDGLTREEINEMTRELISVLVTNSEGNLLEIANSIWYRENFPVLQEFIDLNSINFNAEVHELDFSDASAVPTINNWVSRKTHDKIDKIIEELDPETMMILINALYFNCLWDLEFNPENTQSQEFLTEGGGVFGSVEMMTIESEFNAYSTLDFSAVELPYKNDKFSMFLFLPSQQSSVDELIEKLDGETWNSWMAGFEKANTLNVGLPRFEFDYDKSLRAPLMEMGLDIAFTDDADFSGISAIDLLISDVLHKTYIKVNEEGTEAAAVTAIVFETTSIGPSIWFNRPFMFAISENSSNSILFIGKVSEPAY